MCYISADVSQQIIYFIKLKIAYCVSVSDSKKFEKSIDNKNSRAIKMQFEEIIKITDSRNSNKNCLKDLVEHVRQCVKGRKNLILCIINVEQTYYSQRMTFLRDSNNLPKRKQLYDFMTSITSLKSNRILSTQQKFKKNNFFICVKH